MNSLLMVFRETVRHLCYYLGAAELDDHRRHHRIYHVAFQHRVTSEAAATGHHPPPHESVTCWTPLRASAVAHQDIVTCFDKQSEANSRREDQAVRQKDVMEELRGILKGLRLASFG